MQLHVLDLDGSITRQRELIERHRPVVWELRDWGPRIRLACRFSRFDEFQNSLYTPAFDQHPSAPIMILYGSGDFHHVTLALLNRLTIPFNLLVIDKHPDWVRGVPFMHCGTWLYHAAHLLNVHKIFHVGGALDFDNSFRWLAPWRELRAGEIVVIPALRSLQRGGWATVPNTPLRPSPEIAMTNDRLEELLRPHREELAGRPLYISLDKDVMIAAESVVNWDSGRILLNEVIEILQTFMQAAHGNMAGMDIVGDWSPVEVRGLLRRTCHWTEHLTLSVDPESATLRNQETNLRLIETVTKAV